MIPATALMQVVVVMPTPAHLGFMRRGGAQLLTTVIDDAVWSVETVWSTHARPGSAAAGPSDAGEGARLRRSFIGLLRGVGGGRKEGLKSMLKLVRRYPAVLLFGDGQCSLGRRVCAALVGRYVATHHALKSLLEPSTAGICRRSRSAIPPSGSKA